MTNDEAKFTKALAILSTAGALLATPGIATQTHQVGAKTACADEKCCPLPTAVCLIGGDALADFYYEPNRPCMS